MLALKYGSDNVWLNPLLPPGVRHDRASLLSTSQLILLGVVFVAAQLSVGLCIYVSVLIESKLFSLLLVSGFPCHLKFQRMKKITELFLKPRRPQNWNLARANQPCDCSAL